MATISRLFEACLRKFDIPLTSKTLQPFAGEISLEDWKKQFRRLHDWKACADAHGSNHRPLEFRLRHIPAAAGHIVDQLDSLIYGFILLEQLQLELATRDMDTKHQKDRDEGESVSDPADHKFQIIKPEKIIADVYENGNIFLNKLFDTLEAIQEPVLYVPIEKLGTKVLEDYGQECVIEKYPEADEDIVDRLAYAISSRVGHLEYLKQWNCEMKSGPHRRGEIPTISLTEPTKDFGETESDPAVASTKEIDEMLTTAIPSPPQAWGQPFRCPYCLYSIIVSGKMSWIRHVLEDLLPYVCVFPECPLPTMLYASHRVWCEHMQTYLSYAVGKDAELQCPLCKKELRKGVRWDVHIGRHLVELAISTLSNKTGFYSFGIDIVYPPDTEEHQSHPCPFSELPTP